MTSDNISRDIAGGPEGHIPVMLDEVLDCLRPQPGEKFIDGTFGAGGYTRAILRCGAEVLAIDRDPDAVVAGREMDWSETGRPEIVEGKFGDLGRIADDHGWQEVDGVVLDIGVSSMQLDQAERGFSFRNDGPLDMRMGQSGVSAADVVNQIAQPDLTRIIGLLGEEKKASLISREIIKARDKNPISTTGQLVEVIERAIHRRAGDKIHPATRTFQALRIFVNRELDELCKSLLTSERVISFSGRLIVVTFHSLEDRIVKQFFKSRSVTVQGSRHLPGINPEPATFTLAGNGLVKPSAAECEINPRARSAKLRWGTRTNVPARVEDMAIFGLPVLADLETFFAGDN